MALKKHRDGTPEGTQASDSITHLLARINEPDVDLGAQINAMFQRGENERLEFKSSVRWNFKAGRTGKEMELAWLKTVVTYLNSNGGVILLGVSDTGEILGLGKDGFANDDKALRHTENLIAQHIGPACFPYIHSRLLSVQDKKVLMIVCTRASMPVFLKYEKARISTYAPDRPAAPCHRAKFSPTLQREQNPRDLNIQCFKSLDTLVYDTVLVVSNAAEKLLRVSS